METNSREVCLSIVHGNIKELEQSIDRQFMHDKLIDDLMNPSSKTGKAFRALEWMDEMDNERELNCYNGSKNWDIVTDTLFKAYIEYSEVIDYVTLIPNKLELIYAVDELRLKFSSKKTYYKLITELGLKLYEE